MKNVLLVAALGLLPGAAVGQTVPAKPISPEREFINPLTLPRSLPGYSQAVAVRGGRTIYVAGQVGATPQGELLSRGDLRAQLTQAFRNLTVALAAAGATPADVVKLNYYVVDYKPELLPLIRAARDEVFTQPDKRPASTLAGVAALYQEGVLVEIEAVAVTK